MRVLWTRILPAVIDGAFVLSHGSSAAVCSVHVFQITNWGYEIKKWTLRMDRSTYGVHGLRCHQGV